LQPKKGKKRRKLLEKKRCECQSRQVPIAKGGGKDWNGGMGHPVLLKIIWASNNTTIEGGP